jgi:hypothetical protein
MGIAQNAPAYRLGRIMELQAVVRPLLVVMFIAIVVSLGSALRHLSRSSSEEDSRKMARALTIRISLSLALLALLIIAWYLGLISPHGLQPAPGSLR